MASRKIEDLTPTMQEKVRNWLARLASECHFNILITCTYRSEQEQLALYAQGRESLEHVNELRQYVGLAPITASENRIVTKLRRGKHQERKALDFVVLDGRVAQWNVKVDVDRNGLSDYQEAGRLAQQCGLIWGGDWNGNGINDETFIDCPHIEEA